MLVLEDLIAKMKVQFPRWMDIRRKVKSSTGGHYLHSIAEQIEEIQQAINEYRKDFFIDKYIGKEDEIITYLYKFHIGLADINSITLLNPQIALTDVQSEFYDSDNLAFYEDGFIYLKQEVKSLEYSIDGYKSIIDSEKIHVWNIFDEFAAFLGIRRFTWESNKELLNRTLAFGNNKANSTEQGLKNAILNNLINIDKDITAEDIKIERPTPENLIKYYDEFETILDHLANVNRDIYRTKRWDLDTWKFSMKSIDYIPHAWDVALEYYVNGIGFDDDLKVEIVDAKMTTDATVFFYKKTLDYINSYIKNNSIKEEVRLDLVKHDDNLKTTNVKYRITGTELQEVNASEVFIESYDYKKGEVYQSIDDLFDENNNMHNDVKIIDNSILDHTKNYKIRFRSVDPLKEMTIDSLRIYNEDTKKDENLLKALPGFEYTVNKGIRSSLTKKYLTEKYHYNNIENAHKELEGFSITNVELPTKLTANIDNCANEPIYYDYDCEQVSVLLQNIKKVNCYVHNNSILSDTVNGEKYIHINMEANSFSCKIHGPYTVVYSINNNIHEIIEEITEGEHDFSIGRYHTPQKLDIKIILNPVNNKQCAITDLMYSKYEFNITTEKGNLINISNTERLPNTISNTLFITMKTYTGFSPILKYVYIGTKINDVIYGDISFEVEENDRIDIKSSNCIVELDTYTDDKLDFSELDFRSTKTVVGLSNESYIEINLDNFKSYEKVYADSCTFETLNYGTQSKHLIKIPEGVYLKYINVIGEHEKLIFKESLSNVLTRKGYLSNDYSFNIVKTNNDIIAVNRHNNNIKFLKIDKNDLIANSFAKFRLTFDSKKIQAKFIDESYSNLSSVTNEYEGEFDYISFYPISTKIYKAINECDVISVNTSVPQIVNTFDNNYQIYGEDTMYYIIESLNEDFDVNFNFNNKLCKYSIDSYPIQITKKDLDNLDFNFEEVTVQYESIIGNTIEIPDYFTVNKDKIEVARYLIHDNNLDIQYLNKHNDSLHEKDYIITETLTVNDTMYNKLKYCNIEEIEEIYVIGEDEFKLTLDKEYSLLKMEGIISWNNEIIDSSMKVFIRYNIKKPKFIKLSLDDLYKKVSFNVNAYELINSVKLYEVNNNDSFNLQLYKEYEESDLVSVKCSNIGFEVEINKSILSFKKNLKNNTIAVKAGYYYLDGDEYYLFADENASNIEHIDNLYFFNVIKENKKLYLNQTTKNEVANAAFNVNAIGTVFNLDCKDKELKGISKVNSITTCESFNYWKSVGMELSIVKGLNGSGIKFKNINGIDGYSFLDISKHLTKDNEKYIISFYMTGEGEAYLGEERILYTYSGNFNKRTVIDPKVKALKSEIEDNIYELEFVNDNSKNSYLIIKGNVIVDDIIVQPKSIYSLDYHTKNITYLNLDIVENVYADYQTRLYLDDEEGAVFDGTEIKDERIWNSSYIDWGYTKVKEIETYEQFKSCILSNMDIIEHDNKVIIKTDSVAGRLTTDSIYIGNVNTIRSFMFKINDVMFDNMKNFKIKVLTSPNPVTGFKEVSMHLDNVGVIDGDKLSSYIKLIVEMPSNKVINSIELFTEYLSDDINNPPEVPVLSGSYISKVLDAQYNTRYKLKDLKFDLEDVDIKNVSFNIRASKENTNSTVWTDWKEISLTKDNNGYKISNKLVFEDYRYFQFKVLLKGANTSVKIKHLDLEVI